MAHATVNVTLLPSAVASPEKVAPPTNGSAIGKLVNDLVEVLNEGPVQFDPKVAMGLAIATPVVALVMCFCFMLCRGVPHPCCHGRFSYWKRMPKEPNGLAPDMAIGEHQDEHAEVDSCDEESHSDQPMPEYEDDGDAMRDVELSSAPSAGHGQRECCSKMAAVLEAGGLESTPSSPASEKSVAGLRADAPAKKRNNGKAKAVTIMAPE
jgi:hypothetical protein